MDEESGELSEEVVDFDGGVEGGEGIAEGGAEVDGVGLEVAEGGVTEAEGGVLQDGEPTAATGWGAMAAGIAEC